jgi:hypothetical protein
VTDDEWNGLSLLLAKGFKWKVPFGNAADERAYRILLDGIEPEQIAGVLRSFVARGQVFGPTPGEIVAELRSDPSAPTFEEAYRLIYGPGGVLRARPAYAGAGSITATSLDRAAYDRATELHPLVSQFVHRCGLARLRALEVDGEYGELVRKDLKRAYEDLTAALDGREVAAIASGRRGAGLTALDPMAALGFPARPQIEAAK